MPKSEILISIDEEEEKRLRAQWEDLRSVARRGTPEYIGLRLSFNAWLVKLAGERALETTPPPVARSESMAPSKKPGPAVPASPLKARGRPRGKTRGRYNLSLDLDLIDWLKAHPEGPAAVANRALRREMERETKAAAKK